MTRVGQLLAAIVDPGNLRLAFWKASAVRRAESYARRYGWFLKMDVRKFRRYEGEWVAGRWTELQLQQRMEALVAFTLPARSRPWRRHVLHRFGVVANGLEPRDPRRQLEQQRQELPVSEPQQQQPGQQEQQHRFPGSAGPSSSGALDDAPADPAAILSPERGVPGQSAVEQGPV